MDIDCSADGSLLDSDGLASDSSDVEVAAACSVLLSGILSASLDSTSLLSAWSVSPDVVLLSLCPLLSLVSAVCC